MKMDRRTFLKTTGAAAMASALPMSLIKVAFGAKNPAKDFTFGYISDATSSRSRGVSSFVTGTWVSSGRSRRQTCSHRDPTFSSSEATWHNLEKGRAGSWSGDHVQIAGKVYYVIGEHDYYLDLGKYWESKINPLWYSFDHKGVHFVVLNSILTYDKWTHKNWSDPMDRMLAMARLDNPEGSPFLVGEKQREWLKKDLEKVDKSMPLSSVPIPLFRRSTRVGTSGRTMRRVFRRSSNRLTK